MKMLLVIAVVLVVLGCEQGPRAANNEVQGAAQSEGSTLPGEVETATPETPEATETVVVGTPTLKPDFPEAVATNGLVIPANLDYSGRFFYMFKGRKVEVAFTSWPRPSWCPSWATWKLHTVPRYNAETPTCMTPEYFGYVGTWWLPECDWKGRKEEGIGTYVNNAEYTTCPMEALVKLY